MDIYQIMARLDAIGSKKTLTESQDMAEPVAEGQMKRHLEDLAMKMSKAAFVANADEYGMEPEEAAEFWAAVNGDDEEIDEAYDKLPPDQLGLDKFSQAALSGGQRKRDALANPERARLLAKQSAQRQVKEVITTPVKKGDRVSVEGKPAVIVGQMKTPAGSAKYYAVRFADKQYPGDTYDQVHANRLFPASVAEAKKAKPDFLDIDKDGDKKEPMKKAAKDKTVAESAKPDFLDIDKDGDKKEPMKKAAKDKNDAKGSFQKQMGGSAKELTKGLSIKEAEVDEGIGKKIAHGIGKAVKKVAPNWVEKQVKADDERQAKAKKAAVDKFTSIAQKDTKKIDEVFPGTPEYELRFGKPDSASAFDKKKISTGTVYSRKHQEEPEAADDDTPKKKGRPVGAKRALGAKGPSGQSKLLKGKGGLKEQEIDIADHGEYDREGDMALNQVHQIADAVAELHSILDADDNLPEWVQSKITKALDYIDTARDYLDAEGTHDSEGPLKEKAVSKAQQKFMGMVHAAKKGAKPASKEVAKVAKGMSGKDAEDFAATKHKGLPAKKSKKEESVEETTVAGSVATSAAPAKSKGGMQFGKGVYEGALAESFEQKMQQLNEGYSVNVSVDDGGRKNITVTASDEQADQLGQMLKMAGLFSSEGYSQVCQHCGGIHEAGACGAEQVEEELANAPDEQYSDADTMINTLSGGLNGPKLQANPNNMGDNPLAMRRLGKTASPSLNLGEVAESVEKESADRLWNRYQGHKSK